MAADITFDTVNLPMGFVNVPYEAAIAYHGNATALSASAVATGNLPTGLALDVALPFSRITGTPTVDGLFTFTLSLTDTAGAKTSGTYTIYISTLEAGEIERAITNRAQMLVAWPNE
jgi:Putative Ig domain